MKEDICPYCGCDKTKPSSFGPEKPDTYLTDVSPMWVNWNECESCGKIFWRSNLVNQNEWLNIKRTKLIDKMCQ